MEATERLTFNPGLPKPHTHPRGNAQPEPVAQQVSSGRAERYDKIAFRLLLFFTFVLMFRPQDTLPFLDPLHLAELSRTSAVIALVAGRLSRGQPFASTPARTYGQSLPPPICAAGAEQHEVRWSPGSPWQPRPTIAKGAAKP